MRIVRAKVMVDHIVRFYLDDGTHVDRDFSLIHGGVFESTWKDPKKFRRVRVVDGHPTWPGELDFCSDAVLRGGLGKRRPPEFAIIGPRGTLLSGGKFKLEKQDDEASK
jgi:hypothetical protein